jgi:hypothetical protein
MPIPPWVPAGLPRSGPLRRITWVWFTAVLVVVSDRLLGGNPAITNRQALTKQSTFGQHTSISGVPHRHWRRSA